MNPEFYADITAELDAADRSLKIARSALLYNETDLFCVAIACTTEFSSKAQRLALAAWSDKAREKTA